MNQDKRGFLQKNLLDKQALKWVRYAFYPWVILTQNLSPSSLLVARKYAAICMMLCLLLTSLFVIAESEPKNYCHDKKTNIAWEKGHEENKANAAWLYMYNARKGLCAAIDTGQISLQDAIALFEEERRQAMLILLKEKEAKKMNQ